MEGPKLRPTVTITTYSSSASSSLSSSSSIKKHQEEEEAATSSEFSTDFFSKFRSQARGLANANRVLTDLSQIKGPTGSIRGHKDVVRKSLEGIKVAYNRRTPQYSAATLLGPMAKQTGLNLRANFENNYPATSSIVWHNNNNRQPLFSTHNNVDELLQVEYLERLQDEEQNQCVVYTTSLGVIRRTFEDSKIVKSILNLNLIDYEERDIFLNQEYKHQLKIRLNSIIVPAIFVDGKHIGGLKELETMNENGELLKSLSKFKMSTAAKSICPCCGNAKFIACQSCNGSRKSTIHHFKFNSIALRCIKCDKNEGLIQCPACSARQTVGTTKIIDQNNNNNTEIASGKLNSFDENSIQISNC